MIRLSPMTDKLARAKKWLSQTGATLDGIIAKRRDLDYRAGEHDGIQKIKNFRSADCVIGGFRYGAKSKVVGSLLLGLYDAEGLLHHVGFTSGIAAVDRPPLTKKLEKLIASPGFTGSAPGGPSRWNQGKENTWQPLQPKLVMRGSTTIMSLATASATVRNCCAGGQTSHPCNARWINLRRKSPISSSCSNSHCHSLAAGLADTVIASAKARTNEQIALLLHPFERCIAGEL